MERVKADNFTIDKDKTGAMLNLDFTCPSCKYETGDFVFIKDTSSLESSFEIDTTCKTCGESVTVICIK